MSVASASDQVAPLEPNPDFDLDPYIYGVAAILGGTANVIMQLSSAPVGYGVVESTVDSGKVKKHPIKRARTTISYLSVALLGTDEERLRYREAVNTSHRPVHSGPNSPVKYNAFSPKLQLWVAACLYKGLEDTLLVMHGPVEPAALDQMYLHSARLATTLQVDRSMWPVDRVAFGEFWERSVEDISIDETVREYLYGLVMFDFLPLPIRVWLGPAQRFVVTGFLPQEFRDQMGLSWTARDQKIFDRSMGAIGAITRRLPGPLRKFPMNFYLADLRLRMRFDRPLV
ncbi:oxygenase MpaB family protein [Antrihabitans spumae]|uniref:Oxygenase MpaB family protein n=1 Tax=Antrihabitans spumae TaxID=3373370 RepID=A0ABW7JYA9_9NOCA